MAAVLVGLCFGAADVGAESSSDRVNCNELKLDIIDGLVSITSHEKVSEAFIIGGGKQSGEAQKRSLTMSRAALKASNNARTRTSELAVIYTALCKK